MTIRRRFIGPSLVLGVSLVVAGCGGGGSSNPSPPVPTPTPTATPTPAGSTCTSGSSHGRRPALRAQNGIVPNRLYVSYRSSTGRGVQSIDQVAGVVRGIDLGSENGLSHRAITLAAGVDTARATAALKANPGVVDVQPVHYRGLLAANPPHDPLFDNYDQWYLFRTNVFPDGWSSPADGAGVAIAVVDTGADETNNDLTTKIDFRESVVNGVKTVGTNAPQDRTVQDTNGHGTNVAGLAAAATDNTIGFAGVGYLARLQIYKVFPDATSTSDCQTADSGDEATAIRDAVTNNASVINLSLGAPNTGGFDQAEHDAVEFAISSGVTVVAAGGNDSAALPDYPGAYPGVIAVGASAVTDGNSQMYSQITAEPIASYSNSGVTLVAPGGDASSTSDPDFLHWIEGYSTTTAAFAPDKCSNNGTPPVCRVLFNGTSQATPQVAGTIALMMADHGGARSLSPATVLSILSLPANSDSLGATTAQQGAGRLNAGKAILAEKAHSGL